MSNDDYELQVDYELELIKRSKYRSDLTSHGKHGGFFTSRVETMNDSKKNLMLIYDSIIYSQFYAPPFNSLLTSETIKEIFRATGRMSNIEHEKSITNGYYAKTAFRIIIVKGVIANKFPFILRWKRSYDLTTVDQVVKKICISSRSCIRQLLNGEINRDFIMSHALLCERYSGVHSGIVYAILLKSVEYDIPEFQLIKKILQPSL